MLVIDRIESGIAVCETEDGRRELPLAGLPAGVREGDCLVCVDGSWQIDREETLRRRQQNHSRVIMPGTEKSPGIARGAFCDGAQGIKGTGCR